MRNTANSFAHQYGISQKNFNNSSNGGIGLNPNLNIEDEYIQNLLKQTHFLNMEIKLMKEKQKQNKGMGIMGILNKDQNPVVTHAVTSNTKYTEMKTKLASMVNNAEAQCIKLDDQNYAVKAQRDKVEKLSIDQERRNIQNKIYVDKEINQNIAKLKENQKKLNQIRQQNSRVKDNYGRIKRQCQQLTNKQTTKFLMRKITDNLDEQFEVIKNKHFDNKKAILQANQKKLQQDDKKNRQDPQYLNLVEENKELLDKLKSSQKQLFELNYKVKQFQELKKLSIRNKDIQSELKKQAVDECQKIKKKLTDRKTQYETKLKDSKNALESNEQIRIAKGKVARKDKQINDLKKKTQMSQNNFKKLSDEVNKLTANLQSKKQSNSKKEKQVQKITAIKNSSVEETNKNQLDFDNAESELVSIMASLKTKRQQYEKLTQIETYLQAKADYLAKQVQGDQGLKIVKIEHLMSLMHNNTGLNQTIKNLMEKWQQIKKFTNNQPDI